MWVPLAPCTVLAVAMLGLETELDPGLTAWGVWSRRGCAQRGEGSPGCDGQGPWHPALKGWILGPFLCSGAEPCGEGAPTLAMPESGRGAVSSQCLWCVCGARVLSPRPRPEGPRAAGCAGLVAATRGGAGLPLGVGCPVPLGRAGTWQRAGAQVRAQNWSGLRAALEFRLEGWGQGPPAASQGPFSVRAGADGRCVGLGTGSAALCRIVCTLGPSGRGGSCAGARPPCGPGGEVAIGTSIGAGPRSLFTAHTGCSEGIVPVFPGRAGPGVLPAALRADVWRAGGWGWFRLGCGPSCTGPQGSG
ncbi:beta-1,3-glucosyltransferase [Platysternon megacephalum]|uniref:Beta-1,3-glucosyltransferase n=1 Tax=Platysternon megacephalum TaxID=55544 RepID=A0A4D9ELP6_9SAUR|nr:beta-1,3-glucosyltransferase [Platysternon megacephalum]